MFGTHAVAWACWPRPTIRRRISPITISACLRLPRTNWFTSSNRFSCLKVRVSRRRRHRRYSSCRRGLGNSQLCHRLRHRPDASVCRYLPWLWPRPSYGRRDRLHRRRDRQPPPAHGRRCASRCLQQWNGRVRHLHREFARVRVVLLRRCQHPTADPVDRLRRHHLRQAHLFGPALRRLHPACMNRLRLSPRHYRRPDHLRPRPADSMSRRQ
jgi:hypothetical protein